MVKPLKLKLTCPILLMVKKMRMWMTMTVERPTNLASLWLLLSLRTVD
ncbi:hypothetical protein SLEP1_g37451 [Rubroshorea leprosula]|uniref:Uncharacterized protein n=1 Tax=Rubroshorea leprosula TaxID=152421 RepID=A0AAV5KUX5_9ROSI|nr:hypothetical protein SLEP1_g37451 [Rubroshorea leprosula]